MFAKKFISLTLALTVGLQPFAAQAVDLGEAFMGITGSGSAISTNDAGRYTSAARTGFTAGGIEIRVPRSGTAPQLVSVTPPRISAGCNGISAHFGGFSFISGAEFGQLLKQIASGAALGFVSSLVMKTLCPACEAVVQELKSAAQAAARLAKDSCDIGKGFAADFTKGLDPEGDGIGVCAETSKYEGINSDVLSAYQTTCKTLWAASTFMNSKIPTTDDNGSTVDKGQALAAVQCKAGSGNTSWLRLSQLDNKGGDGGLNNEANVRKLMLINLMGADMISRGAGQSVGCDTGNGKFWEASEGGENNKFCAPVIDARRLTGYFMCGASLTGTVPVGKMSSRIIEYCKSFLKGGAPGDKVRATQVDMLWQCKASRGGPDDYAQCNYLQLANASDVVKGEGFLVQVNSLLREGVQRVRDGTPFMSGGKAADDKAQRILALINAAPYPLYQVINAAAVYPAAADELVDSMSVLVAEQFAYAMFDEMLRLEGRSSDNYCMSRAQATTMLDFVGSLRSQTQANFAVIARQFSVQQGISEQIRQVNQAIQRQVMSQDLLATGQLSESLNKAITGTGGGSRSSAPASSAPPP
jgi:conjugative transfer pilus assembly protein TraH